jgi:putative inorganic carbon (HCO3(-)) transporter
MQNLAINRFYSYGFLFLFIAIYLAYQQVYFNLLVIPALLCGICLLLLSLDKILLIIAFCTPFSVKILFGDAGINIINEPLMLVMLGVFFIKIFEKKFLDKTLFKQPLTLAVLFNLVWLLVTTLTSSMPFISFKFFLARLWCVITGFFWGSILFKNPEKIKTFLLAFGCGLMVVIFYTTYNHYGVGFNQDDGNKVMKPLMDDHTVYGAVCSMVLIYSLVILFFKKANQTFLEQVLALSMGFCALTGVFLSYSRAAWLSVIFSAIFYLILLFKIKFHTLLISLLLILSFAVIYHDEIYQKLRFNKAASGKTITSDIKSISNVRNDESNVERLNKWEAGWRMFQDRPFFGFGPSTYMFKYSPYQRAHEMTSISSTTGTVGGIHSEYFGPLIESGVIGLLSTLLLFGTFIKTAMQTYYQTKNRAIKMLSLAILLSLSSYFFHGLMNNFLDQDKAAVIFWAMMGMCVSLSMLEKTKILPPYLD